MASVTQLAVREAIERVANPEVDGGFEISILNSRGVVSRGLNEGGEKERARAAKYAGYAVKLGDRWPRTSTVLRRIVTIYEAEGRSEDDASDLRSEGLW
jgi:hypothetical protein